MWVSNKIEVRLGWIFQDFKPFDSRRAVRIKCKDDLNCLLIPDGGNPWWMLWKYATEYVWGSVPRTE